MFKRSAVFALICSISSLSFAQEVKPVEVAAGDLTAALESLARQIGVELVYQSDQLKGLTTEGVAGVLSAEEAVTKLLEGTALTLRTDPSGAMLIARERPAESTRVVDAAQFMQGGELRLAQDKGRSLQEEREEEDEEVFDPEYVSDENPRGIPEIMVIGSRRTLNMDIERTEDDTQPYVIFDRNTIARSNARDVQDFLKRALTMSSSGATGSTNSQSASPLGNTSTINLRGLGANETLILVDGHRTASFGFAGIPQQPDLNGIPLSAIERIEVLPTTASGIYGGGATGGVINVVLRRDYSGLESKIAYENTFDRHAGNRRVDLSAGFNLENGRTNVLLAGSYSDASALLVRERDFLQSGRARVLANNPGAFFGVTTPPLGATTNIRSLDGDLTLKDGTSLNSPITFVPPGYVGPASDGGAALIANAGQYNLNAASTAQAGGGNRNLLNAPTISSLTATFRREMTSSLQAFVELSASNNSSYFATNGANSSFTIADTAPSNPFNQSIRVTTPALGADENLVSTMYNRRAIGGLLLKLPKEWRAEADYTWNRTRFFSSTGARLNSSAAAEAVQSGVLDILRDTNIVETDFGPYLLESAVTPPVHTELTDISVRASGPIWSLPGGPLMISALVEARNESFDDFLQFVPLSASTNAVVLSPSRSQSVESAYLEARIPVVMERNAVPGFQLLELQLAGRFDNYRTEGANQLSIINGNVDGPARRSTNKFNSIDPMVGMRYRPITGVMLRASYGTGFLPPGVNELVPDVPQVVSEFTAASLMDPQRGDESLGPFAITTGGNPDLRPEMSRSWSAGMVLTPTFATGLRVSVDWTKIDKTNNIAAVFATTQADLNTLINFAPERITRGPASPDDPFGVGPIVAVDSSRINIARTHVEAYDFSVDYSFDTERLGRIEFSSSATRFLHFRTQAIPTAPVVEEVGIAGNLEWKASATATWSYGNWVAAWTASYFDSYWINLDHAINANQGTAHIPSQIYHDLFSSYQFGVRQDSAILSNMEIHLGVKNLFNTEPPIDASFAGSSTFYSQWGDPRLASFFVAVRKSF